MFSKSCEYGIRAMIFVAQKSVDGARIGAKEIAKGIDAPEHFIAKILQELSKRKLIHSVKGPNGGFFMDENHAKISIGAIVRAIDENGIFVNCVLGLKTCSEQTPCPLHFEYNHIKFNLIQMLEQTTLGEFNEKLNLGHFHLKNI